MTSEEVDRLFLYRPARKSQIAEYRRLWGEAQMLARTIWLVCPESREKDLAITRLQEVAMWATASVAMEGKDE